MAKDYEKELMKINEQKIKLKIKELELKNKHYQELLKKYSDLIDIEALDTLNNYINKTIGDEQYKITKQVIRKAVKRIFSNMTFEESDFQQENNKQKT